MLKNPEFFKKCYITVQYMQAKPRAYFREKSEKIYPPG